MADLLAKIVPLPLPRPIIEEVVNGAENAGIRLDIPLPEMADIDLTYPLVGLDWVLYPWTLLKGKTMELLSQLNTGWFERTDVSYPDYTDAFIFLGIIAVVVVVGFLLKEGIQWAVSKIVGNK